MTPVPPWPGSTDAGAICGGIQTPRVYPFQRKKVAGRITQGLRPLGDDIGCLSLVLVLSCAPPCDIGKINPRTKKTRSAMGAVSPSFAFRG
jgi:hypothetical protein